MFVLAKPLTVLEGWNGSGKTSILNAIIWALTGQILCPQRKPEETEEEFACRIAATVGADPSQHKITAITPLPGPYQVAVAEFPRFPDVVDAFIHGDHRPSVVRQATLAVAGPVYENRCALTNCQ